MMKKRKLFFKLWPFLLFLALYIGIFHKVFLQGLFPFPGDLLVSWFFPYKNGGWEGFSSWITHKEFIASDVVRQIYPWRELAMEIFKTGSVPLWNPHSFSGTPLLANVQSAVFYPLNVLFLFIKPIIAWNTYVLLQPVLAWIGMYLFLRARGLSKYAATFSGLSFGFIGYVQVWFELGIVGHTAIWLPFVVYAIEKYFQTKKNLFLTVVAVCIGSAFLAGHVQTAIYVFGFSSMYAICMGPAKLKIQTLLRVLGMLLLGVLIAAVQIIPSFELMAYSARDTETSRLVFYAFHMPWHHLVMLLAPDFFGNPATGNFWGKDYGEFLSYIGVTACILAVVGIQVYFKDRFIRFLLAMIGLSLLITFNTPLSNLMHHMNIPVLSTGIPSRILFIVEFSLVVLAGYGIEALIQKKKVSYWTLLGIFGAYLGLWIFVMQIGKSFVEVEDLLIAKRNLILPTALSFATLGAIMSIKIFPGLRVIAWGALLVCAAFEYQYALYKFQPFAPLAYAYPEHELVSELQNISPPNRVFGYDTARLETNLAVPWRVYSPEGYDPLYIRRYGELIESADTGKLVKTIPRSDAWLADSLPIDDVHTKQTLLNIMGVKYMLDKDDSAPTNWQPRSDRFPANRFELIYQKNKWKIYENKQALPRATIFYSTKTVTSDSELIATFYNPEFAYDQTVLIEESMQPFSGASPSAAVIQKYSSNRVEILTDSSERGLLFLSDVMYPGWHAYVDGKESKIYRADYAFRAVEIPEGTHTVTFRYKPWSFYLGGAISIIAIILAVGVGLIRTRK